MASLFRSFNEISYSINAVNPRFAQRSTNPIRRAGMLGVAKVPVDRDNNPSAIRAHRLSFCQSNQQTRDRPDDDLKVN